MNARPHAVQIAQRTEKGPRATNQDVVLVREIPGGGWLTAVADGMGGLEAGEIASRTAIDVFEQQILAGRPPASAVEDANAAVLGRADDTPMGTTLVAAVVRPDGVRILNVGDSRAYRLSPLGLSQVTHDHTVKAEAERNGTQMDPSSERWSNALTRSLGAGLEVRVDEFGPFEMQPGETLLLCSDGVHGTLIDEEISHWLSVAPDAQTAVDRLIEAALEGGTHDNLSGIVLRWPAAEAPGHEVTGPGADTARDAADLNAGAAEGPEAKRPETKRRDPRTDGRHAEASGAGPDTEGGLGTGGSDDGPNTSAGGREDETGRPNAGADRVTPAPEPVSPAASPVPAETGPTPRDSPAPAVVSRGSATREVQQREWDPARLATLSHRKLPKKPGSGWMIVRALTLIALLVVLYVLVL